MSGAGPERLSLGRAPGWASYPPRRSWPQPHWGRWVRYPAPGIWGTLGEAHFREDHWRAALPAWHSSPGPRVPLRGAEEDGGPLEGAQGSNGVGEVIDGKGPGLGGVKWEKWRRRM